MPRSNPSTTSSSCSKPVIVVAAGPSASTDRTTVAELTALLEGLGHSVAAIVRQRRPPDSPTWIGPGKVAELRELLDRSKEPDGTPPPLVLADEVDAGRMLALETAVGTGVLDRTEIILRVFEARAETPLAKLEIERARLVHALPRIRQDHRGDDREGGGGRAARGSSNVVLSKQTHRKRIADLGKRIDALRTDIDERIERRSSFPRIALIGYTNAGKSSWMRSLTASNIETKDELFHTLGTRVRALSGAGRRVLLADTVGFLEGLPHALLEAFHSTLAEALAADLWVHVADASSRFVDPQIETTRRTLERVGAREAPTLLLLNKCDNLEVSRRRELEARYPEALFVSSFSAADRGLVLARLRKFAEEVRSPRFVAESFET